MPRWRELPDELDPQVREFTLQLRRLVERSHLSLAAVADRTGYSKTSWERYLNGRLLPPQGAVEALARVTGADVDHVLTVWELAERAWSRAEMRHDVTMEAIRVAQARAALGEFGPPPMTAEPARERPGLAASKGPYARSGERRSERGEHGEHGEHHACAAHAACPGHAGRSGRPGGHPEGRAEGEWAGEPPYDGRRHRVSMFLGGIVGALLLIAAVVLLLDPHGGGSGREKRAVPPTPSRSVLPSGVKCVRDSCDGKDPETMGCGGPHAKTSANATIGPVYVEVRYSRVCGAAWARLTQAAPGDAVRVSAPDEYGGRDRSQRSEAGADGDGYTHMIPVGSAAAAKACVTLTEGTSGCAVTRVTTGPAR